MSSMAQAAALNDPRVPPASSSSADRASLISWIAVLASMIGAFMTILNIQITRRRRRRSLIR